MPFADAHNFSNYKSLRLFGAPHSQAFAPTPGYDPGGTSNSSNAFPSGSATVTTRNPS